MENLRRLLLVLTLPLLAFASCASAAETPLPMAVNLAQKAAETNRQGAPFILMVSLTGCPFCEKIRRQHLAPLTSTGVVVQQIYLDTDTALIDFDGQPTTQRQFASARGIKITPTLFFFDAKGAALADPIVGALIDDFYGAILEESIATARRKLASSQ